MYLDSSNSTGKQTHEIIHLESSPNDETDAVQNTANELVEGDELDNNETEEHEGGPPSSISDIHYKRTPEGGIPEDFQKEHQLLNQQSKLIPEGL